VAGERVAGRAVDLFEDDAGLGDAEAGTAIRLRNQRREITAGGQRIDKGLRIFAGLVDVAPIRIGKPAQILRIASRIA
jgi:hypothetical protein